MNLKLILKQSFRDFISKITLYLTFTLFLILTISISLGMVSFSYGYNNFFNETLGSNRVNAAFQSNTFIPAGINDDSADFNKYVAKENTFVKDGKNVGYLYEFLKNLNLKREDGTVIETPKELNQLLLGAGYRSGSVPYGLETQDILGDSFLAKHIPLTELSNYNQNAIALRHELDLRYQTYNLVVGFLIQYLFDHPSDFNLGSWNVLNNDLALNQDNKEIDLNWDFLRIDETMGNIDKNTPDTLKVNPTNTQKIWKAINLSDSQYQKYRDNYHFVYVPSNFLHHFHYKIGDTINLRFKTWDHYERHPFLPETFLIAGTINTPNLIAAGNYYSVSIPYPFMVQTWDYWFGQNGQSKFEQVSNRQVVFQDSLFLNVKKQNGNLIGGQKEFSNLFSAFFTNRQNPKDLLQSSVEWSKSNSAYAFKFSQILFITLSYLISFLAFCLLFVVFYFITKQIVALQKRTLFFLKAMGVKNSGLSFFLTLTMMPSLFISLIFGFFGSLTMQQMMCSIALENLAFYLEYWSFNFMFFISFFTIAFFIFLFFYLINISLVKSKILSIEGINSNIQVNNLIFKSIKSRLQYTSPKFKIGISFVFQNIYKNLISFFILLTTFSLILFGYQFNIALNHSASAYEKWNFPYQSVFYANNLNIFAPTRENNNLQENEYIRAYNSIDSLDGLQPITKFNKNITDPEDLTSVIYNYYQKLNNRPSNFTNWQNYYFDKNFVKEYLSAITDSQEKFDEFIKIIINLFGLTNQETIFDLTKTVEKITTSYRNIRNQYNYQDGFTILMGQVYMPNNNRAVLSLEANLSGLNSSTTVLAYAPNDFETQSFFNLKDFSGDQDFLIPGQYEQTNPSTNEKETINVQFLRVNISSYLASTLDLHQGSTLKLNVTGLKSAENIRSSIVYAYVNDILEDDTITSTIYTSQAGLIASVIANINQKVFSYSNDGFTTNNFNFSVMKQKEAYEEILNKLNNQNQKFNLNNTVYDTSDLIPWGIRYLTIPFFHHSDLTQEIGTLIEDFYDGKELSRYFEKFGGKDIMVFHLATQTLLNIVAPFQLMIKEIILLLLIISLIISVILIALVLLENREIILLFKALGYKKSEINWYLISGYFIAVILATLTASILSFVILNIAQKIISPYLAIVLHFIWNWQFIFLLFSLVFVFCFLISLAIVIYTNCQKPYKAFDNF